jgi:hypothetical protein
VVGLQAPGLAAHQVEHPRVLLVVHAEVHDHRGVGLLGVGVQALVPEVGKAQLVDVALADAVEEGAGDLLGAGDDVLTEVGHGDVPHHAIQGDAHRPVAAHATLGGALGLEGLVERAPGQHRDGRDDGDGDHDLDEGEAAVAHGSCQNDGNRRGSV